MDYTDKELIFSRLGVLEETVNKNHKPRVWEHHLSISKLQQQIEDLNSNSNTGQITLKLNQLTESIGLKADQTYVDQSVKSL